GTEQVETGHVRLRKYVVTEEQQVTVPVRHEEVRIEREPIKDGQGGADIGEAEQDVVLHAEKPVVRKESVPVERARLRTETVTDEQTVSGKVRKEQFEVTDDDGKHRK
ncbi:YsnF/AvaK domain-containing protein, partial [Amycolatopsis sp. NPDC051371]|uniref:YsnF/AvaK domain-containing protein n=1 Tax=Amycolatopsis sp. NPDC051371 TaxID=3155800 RepID=UPI003441F8E3